MSCVKIVFLVILLFLPFNNACSNENVDAISVGAWINEISDRAGIYQYEESEPYFLNIQEDSSYYEAVQAEVEWGVLETIYPIQPDEDLTKEWCAYTLVNLLDYDESQSITLAKDIQSSKFASYINTAISLGLMPVDERELFHPKDKLDRSDALKYLDIVVERINNKEINEENNEIIFDESKELHILDDLDAFNSKYVDDIHQYQVGDYISESNTMDDIVYEITDIKDNQIYYEQTNPLSLTEMINVEGEETFNFDEATIIGPNGEVISEGKSSYNQNDFVFMSHKPLYQTFSINNFDIKISTSTSAINVTVERKMSDTSKFYGELKLSGLNVKYQWKSKKEDIDTAYLRLNYALQEKVGFSNTLKKEQFADFSELDDQRFFTSLDSLFKSKNEVVEDILKLCTVKLPVANVPGMDLTLQISLKVYTNGKAEIVLTQSNADGFEIKNEKLRLIKDHHGEANCNANASLNTSVLSNLSLCLITQPLMDAEIELGAKISAKGKLHLYDSDGKKKSMDTDIATDLLVATTQANKNSLSCVDLSGNWIAKLKLNSSNSVLGKYGLSHTFNLLENKNSDIFAGVKHLENWITVKACTRDDRNNLEDPEDMNANEDIKIDTYAIILNINESKNIDIDELPDSYTNDDLVFSSSDTSIAKVSSNGEVTGIKKGNAIIDIKTKDKKYVIHCNVIVLDSKYDSNNN